MRWLLIPIAGLVFAAGLVLDPAGVLRLAYVCGTGGCGIRPMWVAAALIGLICAGLVLTHRRRRISRAAPAKKPRAGGRRKSATPAKTKSTRRRKMPARA